MELLFPTVNILMFAWIIKDKQRHLPSKIQVIYLLCPALALVLSITQAFTIQVTLTESIHTVRFFIAKLLDTLLKINKKGRLPIENFFDCEFFNEDDIIKPPCSGQLHDTVVSGSTLTIVIVVHIIPVIAFLYLLIKNLSNDKSEHLFLYIESVEEGKGKGGNGPLSDGPPRTLRHTVSEMLTSGFNVKFMPKKLFHDKMRSHSVKRPFHHRHHPHSNANAGESKPETSV